MCKYIIMSTETDIMTGNVKREFSAPLYDSAKQAHEVAHEVGCASYRVFPSTDDVEGIDAMARMMTRTACRLLLEKTNGDNINTLNLLNRIRAATYAENVTDADTLDCIGAATVETWAAIVNGENIHEQAALALRGVYRHIRGERGYFNGRRERLLYLDSMDDGDITFWGAMVDTIAGEIDAEEQQTIRGARLMDCINNTLTSEQRKIMLLLSEGMTQANIARIVGKSLGTISHHVKLARATLARYMIDNNIPLPDGVTVDDVAVMIGKAEKRKAANSASANAAHKNKI